MKVKYLKESNGWIDNKKEYEVLILEISITGKREILIMSEDNNTAILKGLEDFVIVSDRIPSNWTVYYERNNTLVFEPNSWREAEFWDSFNDDEENAKKVFNKEYEIIKRES